MQKMLINNNKIKILLVGPYPPPYGGISVHIERLNYLLNNSNDFVSFVLDVSFIKKKDICGINLINLEGNLIGKIIKWFFFVIRFEADIIHFHVSALRLFQFVCFILLFIRNKKKLITIHSGSFIDCFNRKNSLSKFIIKAFLKLFDSIIAVNREQVDFLQNKLRFRKRICLIPAFLPPLNVGNYLKIQEEILLFKKEFSKIILTSGFMLEYYGFHVIIEAMIKLNEKSKIKAGLIIVYYSEENDQYIEQIQNYAKKNKFIKLYNNLPTDEFIAIMQLSDIFVRATDRDGDAVSLREAMYFRKQIIASDCVRRPEGIITFKTMDADSLLDKLIKTINNNRLGKVQGKYNTNNQLFNLYKEIKFKIVKG